MTREVFRNKRARANRNFLLLLAGLILFVCLVSVAVVIWREKQNSPVNSPVNAQETEFNVDAPADQDNYDFELYPGETVESAKIRSNTEGTGLVYINQDGEPMSPPAIYIYNIRGEAPKFTFDAMYRHPYGSPDEGAEPMICVPAEGMSDNPGDTAYYCEAESLYGQD